MRTWPRQVRHSLRGLLRRPGFALTVVSTLALGIGANTAIFSVVDGVLFEPLPYPESDRLVFVWGSVQDDASVLLSGPQGAEVVGLDVFAEATQVFGFGVTSMARDEVPEPVRTLTVSHSFFDVFGIQPLLGRTFRAEDEFKLTNEEIRDPELERPIQSVVLSHHLWRQSFGADPHVLGQLIRIGGHRHEIVGVMPAGFRADLPSQLAETAQEDVWVMSTFDQASFPRDTRFVRVIGRLAEGLTLARTQSVLDDLSAWQRANFLEEARDGFHMRASPLRAETGATAKTPLTILLTAVGLVLLIACANVITLLLMRATERDTEIRLRRALGAGTADIASVVLSESTVLAFVGGAIGLLLAPTLTSLLLVLAPAELPRTDTIGLDGSVLGFSALVTVAVAVLAGLPPTLRSLRAAGRGVGVRVTPSRRERWAGGLLVSTEVALAVVLVIGTGLLLRSLGNTLESDPGFETDGLYAWEAMLASQTYPTWESRLDYFRGAQEALRGGSEVAAMGLMTPVPFAGADHVEVRLGTGEQDPGVSADLRRAGPGALEALGAELIEGRLLEWPDMEDFDRLHAVVDERFARQAWPGESAIGQVIGIMRREYGDGSRVWDDLKRVEVVGVVRPVRGRDVRTPDPATVYVTYSQNMWGNPSFIARSAVPLTSRGVREVLTGADPLALTRGFTSIDAVASRRIAPLKFALTLIGLFAALGLVLALTGVYGLFAYRVRNHERELHIRAVLGASRRELSAMVIRSGLLLTGSGVVVGWLVAVALTRFLDSFLFGIAPTDPVTFIGVAFVLMVTAVLACWAPSRRAARSEPANALR